MQRQQVHAAARARAEALLQSSDEVGARSPSNCSASRTSRARSACRVCSRSPSFSGGASSQPCASATPAHRVARGRGLTRQRLQQPPRRVAREQRRTLERDAGLVERLLEVGRARVRAHEHRLLLERRRPQRLRARAIRVDDVGILGGARIRAPGPSASVGAQRLLGAAELRHEPVREREHLRRRAVVLLEPHDVRVREALAAARAATAALAPVKP